MKNSFDEKIFEEAKDWIDAKQKVVLATVIQTWGSSPRPVGSHMIINNKGDFSGSVSGGCVETSVVQESIELIEKKQNHKIIEFKVADENAWEIGLACGGEIAIFLEKIN
jgi:xanthine/CO dehydrogenase XdhC/CoxF family maturation factor